MEMDVWLAVFGGHPTVKAVGTGAFLWLLVVGCGFWVVGIIVYLTIKPTTHNQQPTTKNKKAKGRNRHIPPFAFYLI